MVLDARDVLKVTMVIQDVVLVDATLLEFSLVMERSVIAMKMGNVRARKMSLADNVIDARMVPSA